MKLKELKEWIAKLPDNILEYELVTAESGVIGDESDELTYRLDCPIISIVADEEHGEILFLTKEDTDTHIS